MSSLNRKVTILIIPIIVLALAIVPQTIRPVHAIVHTGLVCLADPTTAASSPTNPCPATPWVFNGPNVTRSQQLSVGVYVHASDNLSSFAITLLANHTVVRPVAVDFSRTLLPGTVTVVRECIAGIIVQGGCSLTDSSDTIDLALQAGFGLISNYPVTGLLFVAIYNITSVSKSPSTPVGYQTGCGSTSVAGGVCITVGNGTSTPVPETAQAASFENLTPPPYVTTSASTNVITTTSGDPGSAVITATGQNGWPTLQANKVTFSAATPATSAGMVASFSPLFCATSGSPSACATSLSVSFPNPGNYSVTILGAYAAKASTGLSAGKTSTLAAPVTLTVRVYNFNITANPKSVAMLTGVPGGSNVTITFGSAFAGTVNFANPVISPSTGLSCTLSPTSLMATGNSTLQCSGSGGIYKVEVLANDGTSTLATNVTFSVQAFTLSSSPSSLTVLAGNSGSSTITLTRASGFTGAVALTDTVTPSGAACSPMPPIIATGSTVSTMMCTTTVAGVYNVNVNGTSAGVPSVAINVPLTVLAFNLTASPSPVTVLVGLEGNSTITVTAGTGFTGMVTLTDSSGSCSQTPATVNLPTTSTSTLSCTFAATGNYAVTVTGNRTGEPNTSILVNYQVQNFTITASAATALIGQTATSTITITAVNGFSGAVSLSDVQPSGLTCNQISPLTVTGSGTATVGCTGAMTISYTLSITGAVGSFTHTTSAVFSFTNFTITVNSPTAQLGNSATVTITIAAINGFSQTVSLTDTPPSGLTCAAITPSSVTGGSGTATVACTGATATSYSLSITGAVGTFTHSATSTINFIDFTISAGTTSVTVDSGVTGSATITIGAANGFSSAVTLTASSTPTGLTCSLTPAAVTTSGTSTLACSGGAGTYTVTVTATSGGVAHNAQVVTYTVNSVSNTSTIFGIPTTYFYAIIAVIIIAVVAGVVLALRRRKPGSGGASPSGASKNPSKPNK